MFSFYTTRSSTNQQTGGQTILVAKNSDSIKSELIGPENNGKSATLPFKININTDSADIFINGSKYPLEKNVYTD